MKPSATMVTTSQRNKSPITQDAQPINTHTPNKAMLPNRSTASQSHTHTHTHRSTDPPTNRPTNQQANNLAKLQANKQATQHTHPNTTKHRKTYKRVQESNTMLANASTEKQSTSNSSRQTQMQSMTKGHVRTKTSGVSLMTASINNAQEQLNPQTTQPVLPRHNQDRVLASARTANKWSVGVSREGGAW